MSVREGIKNFNKCFFVMFFFLMTTMLIRLKQWEQQDTMSSKWSNIIYKTFNWSQNKICFNKNNEKYSNRPNEYTHGIYVWLFFIMTIITKSGTKEER